MGQPIKNNQNNPETGVLILNSHFLRLIKALDSLYEFGPSYLNEMNMCSSLKITEYGKQTKFLSLEQISIGLTRLKALSQTSNLKRIAPSPSELVEICLASDQQWLIEQPKFLRTRKN